MRGPAPIPVFRGAAPALAIWLAACGAGGSAESGATCSDAATVRTGEATYYTLASGAGACMLDPDPGDLMTGAMNAADYEGSRACGACVALTGPGGSTTIRVVDLCPECARGDVDLSPEAFERISPLAAGRVPISWRWVSCDVAGPIRYHFKEGSNASWLAVQIRDHVNRIARVEARVDGRYSEVLRADYNYFVVPTGLGSGPFTFRVTDVHGHSVEDAAVPFAEAGDPYGAGQFPACAGP